jgi:dihydroorotase
VSIREALDMRAGDGVEAILRSATVLDPAAGISGVHDVVVSEGRIAELAEPGAARLEGAEEVDAEGLHAFPAFFDPHVHLRTPGQEH